jgi:hypothetical protein
MCDDCLHIENKSNGCNTVIGQIENLSEEGQLKLIRRGRDTFNKNKEAQLQMLSFMITGGLIHKDDLN